jgi:hypothetical protein
MWAFTSYDLQRGYRERMSTFRELDLETQGEYLFRFGKCQQKCSDYSFVNLWSWRRIYGLRWSFDNTLVWLRQTRKEIVYWAPVGDWDAVDWQEAIGILQRPARLTRVPQRLMEILRECARGQGCRFRSAEPLGLRLLGTGADRPSGSEISKETAPAGPLSPRE